jgi:hypothetical protein
LPDDPINDPYKPVHNVVLEDPMSAVEAETLNKQRNIEQDNADLKIQEEQPIALKERNKDEQVISHKEENPEKENEEPLDEVDPAVLNKNMQDEVIEVEENKVSEPLETVNNEVPTNKIQTNSPATKLSVKASKAGKVRAPRFEDDHVSALPRGQTNTEKKNASPSAHEKLVISKLEDEAVIDKKNKSSEVDEQLDVAPELAEDYDPLDAVEGVALLNKMPNDPLGRSKTAQIKKNTLNEDNALLRERTKRIPSLKEEVPAATSNPIFDPNKDLPSATAKNNEEEIGGVQVVDQKQEEGSIHEDPLEHVNPKVLTIKVPGSPAHQEPAFNKLPDDSQLSDDPLDLVEAKVFDRTPGTKQNPIEHLRNLGYDASKYNMNEIVEIEQPARSIYYLGNIQISQIEPMSVT